MPGKESLHHGAVFLSINGTGAVHQSATGADCHAGLFQNSKLKLGQAGNFLGREAQPNTLGGFICTRSEYNARGQLVKSFADTGADTAPTAATLYEYDAMNTLVKQTLALSDTPTVPTPL